MKVIFIDFEDSFTFNIVSELENIGLKSEVICYKNIDIISSMLFNNEEKKLLVLGPGPGHPDDYDMYFPVIQKAISDTKIFIFSICLGHQILWRSLGESVFRKKRPIHGDTVVLNFRNVSYDVQKYNSLSVAMDLPQVKIYTLGQPLIIENSYCENRELLASISDNFVSYQFHPESIGTSCRRDLFLPVLELLYNDQHDELSQSRRHLRFKNYKEAFRE